MKTHLVLLSASFIATNVAWAQPTPPPREAGVIQRPDWVRRPSANEFNAVFPAQARRLGIDGQVTLRCEVSTEGTMRRCAVEKETPPGHGYAAAAVALSSQFVMRPPMQDGRPVEGHIVRIPIVFQTGGPAVDRSPVPPIITSSATYIARPVWVAAPTRAEVAAVYPDRLRGSGAVGTAQIDCALDGSGRPRSCTIASEQPDRNGAGQAALRLAPKFRVGVPRLSNGAPIRNARVRIPVTFSPSLLTAGVDRIARSEWGQSPEGSAVASAFPARATAAGVQRGEATLACTISAGGSLSGCSVARETPAGLGFAHAALALAPSFRMSAWTSDGRPVDGTSVRIPVRFEAGTETAADHTAGAQQAG